jgi:hypothetical protein
MIFLLGALKVRPGTASLRASSAPVIVDADPDVSSLATF